MLYAEASMSILEELNEDSVWDSFLQYKLDKNHLSAKEQEEWTDFIENREYRSITEHLFETEFTFDYPIKICVNKSGTRKKRINGIHGVKMYGISIVSV